MFEQHKKVLEILSAYRFNFANELELQDGIEAVLLERGIDYVRELRLSPGSRIDFLADDVGIEVKIAGSSTNLLRQIARYAKHDEIKSLIVVCNRAHLTCVSQAEFGDKPVDVVFTSAVAL